MKNSLRIFALSLAGAMMLGSLSGCLPVVRTTVAQPPAEQTLEEPAVSKEPQATAKPAFDASVYADVPTPEKKAKVIFDTDMGVMFDDAKALVMLLKSGVVDILGITCVIGNTYVEEGVATTLRQLEMFGYPDIPVYQGIGEPLRGERYTYMEGDEILWGAPPWRGTFYGPRPENGYLNLPEEPTIGYPTIKPQDGNAVDFIAEAVKANPGEVTLIAIGPCSNIAVAVKTYPEIVPLVKQIIYMGGAFDVPGNISPAAEYNWWVDPEAAKICLNAPFKRQVIVPLDACTKAFVNKDFFDRIAAAPETPVTKLYVQSTRDAFENSNRPTYVFDELAVAMLLQPELATSVVTRYVDIDVSEGLNYGRSTSYEFTDEVAYGKPVNVPVNTQPCEIVMDVDVEKSWDLMVDLLTSP